LTSPALTGDVATDRKNYIEQCFVMDVEGTTRQRKSTIVTDQCNVSIDNPSCALSSIGEGNEISLDPQEVPSDRSAFVWDKCGDFPDELPDDVVGYVDQQIANLRATAGFGSARRKRRY